MKMNVLLHVIATNKYDRFVQGIVESAKKHFLKDHDIKIVVYTDSDSILSSNDDSIIPIKIQHEAWPGPTLKRFHYFQMSRELILSTDFSFYVDVDSLFIKDISTQSLGIINGFQGYIGTLHPGFYGKCGTPERRPDSTAFIPHERDNSYYCGGFFGGSSKAFLKMIDTIKNNIDLDLSKNIIAIWHDESHLNRYFLDNPPKSVLGLGFSCPEERRFKEGHFMEPSIIFLDKEPELKIEKGQNVY